jgi:hypothetical protein
MAVFLAIVAPTVGLLGAVLGAWMTRRNADRQWRLTARRELYTRLALASEDVRSCVVEMIEPEGLSEGRWMDDRPHKTRYADALKRFFEGLTEAAIVASPEVFDALRAHAAEIVKVIDEPEPDASPARAFLHAFERLSTSSNALLDAMRVDLGFGPPLNAATEWTFGQLVSTDPPD